MLANSFQVSSRPVRGSDGARPVGAMGDAAGGNRFEVISPGRGEGLTGYWGLGLQVSQLGLLASDQSGHGKKGPEADSKQDQYERI